MSQNQRYNSRHPADLASADIRTINVGEVIECPRFGKGEIELEGRRVIPGIPKQALATCGPRAVKTLVPDPSNRVADIDHRVHDRFTLGIEAKNQGRTREQ